MRVFLALAMACLLLSACQGYVLHENSTSYSLEVPFIPGDEDGLMTQEVILALERSGLNVVREGRYELQMVLEKQNSRTLGFTYVHDDEGNLTSSLGANEERIHCVYLISLVDKHAEEILAGPDRLEVNINYDLEVEEVPYNSVQDSMGQLNIGSEAMASAKAALGRRLAKEVAVWMHTARLKRLFVR
jgi:hypothetical protein